jgi:hypothetical protein
MGAENSGVGEVSGIQDLLIQRLRYKYVTSGDLAAIALARGWAREVRLTSNSNILYIDGKFYFDPNYYVNGFWKLPSWRRKFFMTLPLVSEGLWAVDEKTYVKVGQEKIVVMVGGKMYLSRLNICGLAETIGGGQDFDVVVHIVGTLRGLSTGVYYTAFRCSEWILQISREPLFDRFAFSKLSVYNDITGRRVEFREVFVKGGRVVKVLVNPSCREYSEMVYKLYGFFVACKE